MRVERECAKLKLELEAMLPRLRGYARCLLCDIEDADEVVCASLKATLTADMNPDGKDTETEAQLFSSTLAAARQHLRQTGRHDEDDTPVNRLEKMGDGPLDMESVMSQLSLDERSVAALHILEGFELGKTATLMNLPNSVVRAHLKSVRKHLICMTSAKGKPEGQPVLGPPARYQAG
jgi:DNA-directed RNA polymerase specialized sigma24 family protein